MRLRSPNLPVATVSEVVRSKSANARLSRWCAQCGTFRARVRHTLFFIYVKTRRRGATDEGSGTHGTQTQTHTHANAKAHTIIYTSPLGPHRSRSRSEGRGGYRGHEPLLVLVKNSLLPLPPRRWGRGILRVGFFRMLHCGERGGIKMLLRPPQS